MYLIIKSIQLTNFKGIKTLDTGLLNEDIVTVLGANGSGKTTIADAISWCLFGKSSTGDAKFGIKTHDRKGNDIPHLTHSVTLNVVIDGTDHSLTRSLREDWVKPRGSFEEVLKGNTTEYFIDAEKVTASDYNKFVQSIASDEIFRLLTSPYCFPSLHWTEQRNLLAKIAGEISTNEITQGDSRFDSLLKELATQSMEQYRKHLSYQIRELKKKIDEMPVRINTLKTTLPEKLAWDNLHKELTAKQTEVAQLDKEINLIKSGNQDMVFLRQTKERLAFAERRALEIRKSKQHLASEEFSKHDADVRNAQALLSHLERTQQDLRDKRSAIDRCIDQCNETIKECESRNICASSEWDSMMAMRFEVSEDMTVCPTCGQPLPEDIIKQTIDKARTDFNTQKASIKQKLLAKAESIKSDRKQAEEERDANIALLKANDAKAAEIAKEVIKAKNELAEIHKMTVKSVDQLLQEDTNYQKILAEIEQLNDSINAPADTSLNDAALSEAKRKKSELQSLITDLEQLLASRSQYDKVIALLYDTEKQWQDLSKQLTALEQQEDLAIQFSDRQDSVLESRVNSLFAYAKFRLFRTQVDGTKVPYCEAYHNGNPYPDLNAAMKLNIGLDIINTLSRYYACDVPVIIDNAESVTDIIDTDCQQFRFYVSPVHTSLSFA